MLENPLNIDLWPQALDGFILVALSDGTVEYVSENIHKHLGLFQSEHIGFSMYDLIFEEDQEEVKRKIHIAEANAFARLSNQGGSVRTVGHLVLWINYQFISWTQKQINIYLKAKNL